jgi:ATP synthase F0 subunit b
VQFWNHYLNYPGCEAGRFFNLLVFILIMIYFLRKPLSEVFKSKRETIRGDLIKAEEERQAALSELTNAESKLAKLDAKKIKIIEEARHEAHEERKRITREVENDIQRMRGQAENEFRRKTQQAKAKLRRFFAEKSISLAEEKIKNAMDSKKDAELVKAYIQSIGGIN